jgi:hypothetical protein
MATLPVRSSGPATTLLILLFGCVPASAQMRPASPALQASSQAKPLPVVIFTSWRDPREGAFTLSVPQGWQVSGGAMRRSAVDITHVIRAGTPDGRVQIFINDADIVAHEVPNQLTAMAGLREGQMTKGAWGGPVLLERYRNGPQFAEEYIRKKICPQAEYHRRRRATQKRGR